MICVFVFPGYFNISYGIDARSCFLRGFWQSLHPMALCGRLGEISCVSLFEGSFGLAWAIHATLLPDVGDFYALERLRIIEHVLELATRRLPLPPMAVLRPRKSLLNWFERRRERRSCCMAATDSRSKWIRNYMKCCHNIECRVCGNTLPMRWDLLSCCVRAKHIVSCSSRRRRRRWRKLVPIGGRRRWRKLVPMGAVRSSAICLGDLSMHGFGSGSCSLFAPVQGRRRLF